MREINLCEIEQSFDLLINDLKAYFLQEHKMFKEI